MIAFGVHSGLPAHARCRCAIILSSLDNGSVRLSYVHALNED